MTPEHDPDETPMSPAENDAAAHYHAPPATVPREAMWNAIQARRAGRTLTPTIAPPPVEVQQPPVVVTHTTRGALSRFLPRSLMAIATAAAIVLVVGLMRSVPSNTTAADSVAGTGAAGSETTTPASADGAAWQVASAEHFGFAETMLTTLATSPDSPGDRRLTAWSRDLLESTRLLMDSPAGRDEKRRVLLQELELVLVQLVESGPTLRTEDRTVMDELLSQSALLLTRIRTTVPAGSPASTRAVTDAPNR